ncbi:TRAP transporter substrate-binding protein [Roseobacter sp. GAI101]|uniref:TRAP transporter substrate-binding protein n=1 Tax=Roseobacter sp. (strain GAI101) TaxID=391589 RepID=UPI000312BCD5|nr:TRAP transporter substrate-binding protein [Roseobacter sp. GAI101]
MRTTLTMLAATTAIALAAPAFAQDFVMKISSPVPPTTNDVVYAWMTAFEQGVEEATDGAIDVQLFPANQLGQIPATVEGVAMGTIEMTIPVIGFLAALEPRFAAMDAAGLFESEEHAMRTFSDPALRELLATFGEAANVEPLMMMTSGQAVVIAQEPIEQVADFQGLVMRTGGTTPLLNRPLEALGVTPVAIPLGEVLPSMQTGQIDASSANMAVLNAFQFQDVATEATYLPGNFTIIGGLISRDFLAMIGPENEAIVRQEAAEALSAFEGYVQNGPAALEAMWEGNGGTIRHLAEDQAEAYFSTVRPVIEAVVADDPQMEEAYRILVEAADRNR